MRNNLIAAVGLAGWFKFVLPAVTMVSAANFWNGVGFASTLLLVLAALFYYVREANA